MIPKNKKNYQRFYFLILLLLIIIIILMGNVLYYKVLYNNTKILNVLYYKVLYNNTKILYNTTIEIGAENTLTAVKMVVACQNLSNLSIEEIEMRTIEMFILNKK